MDKNEIIINLLKLVPVLLAGGEAAYQAYASMLKLLDKDGVTPEEMKAATDECSAVLAQLRDSTA